MDPAQVKRQKVTLPNGRTVHIKKSSCNRNKKKTEEEKRKESESNKKIEEKKTEQEKTIVKKIKSETETQEQQKRTENKTRNNKTKSDTQKLRQTHARRMKHKTSDGTYSGSIERFLVRIPKLGPLVAAGTKPGGENPDRESTSSSNLNCINVNSKSGASPQGIGGESL